MVSILLSLTNYYCMTSILLCWQMLFHNLYLNYLIRSCGTKLYSKNILSLSSPNAIPTLKCIFTSIMKDIKFKMEITINI